jgi:hypothetical protein
LSALAAGALFGLAVVGGISFALVRRAADTPAQAVATAPPSQQDPSSSDTSALSPGPDAAATPMAGLGEDEASLQEDSLSTGPSSINPEYELQDVLAVVNGDLIAMRDLDRAVRVARVLGQLSGEPAPANGSPELRAFQIQMLKRLVDLELMAQAAEREGLMIPGGDVAVSVDGFLGQVAKSRQDLDVAMAEHGVTEAELDRWFRDARTANFFVAQSLMAGDETGDRDAATQQWLAGQWDTQSIVIDFYEPEVGDG